MYVIWITLDFKIVPLWVVWHSLVGLGMVIKIQTVIVFEHKHVYIGNHQVLLWHIKANSLQLRHALENA